MKKKLFIVLILAACAISYGQVAFWEKLQSRSSADEMIALCNQELRKSPEDYYVYFYRAVIRLESGNLAGALKDYNKVLSLEPRFSDAYVGRAQTKERLGDSAGAESDLAKAKTVDHILDELDDTIEQNKLDPKAYLDRAFRRERSRPPDYRGAVMDFESYLVLTGGSPSNSLPYIYLANCYRLLGLHRKADSTLTRGIVLFPNSAHLYRNRLGIRKEMGDVQGLHKDEETLKEFAKAGARETIANQTELLKKHPGNIYALTTRAKYYIKLGDLDAAQADVTAVLHADNKNRTAKQLHRNIARERGKISNK